MFTKQIMVLAMLAFATTASPGFAATDWSPVATALGKSGTEMPGGIYRVGLPRSDLHVVLDGVVLKPSLALGSWLAFARAGDKTMVMGDLVLTEDEIEPVMKSLAESGIDITALHNHLLRVRPATYYMHVYAQGDAVALAKALHNALALSKTPFTSSPTPRTPPAIGLDTASIEGALGAKGKVAGGVYQVGIPRASPVMMHGMAIPPTMGVAEAINFQPTGKDCVAITGDFVLTAEEVNPVLRALRENGIEVTALHNHMLEDQPHLFFMHYWANGRLDTLLTGLKAALAHIAVKTGK